jgi:phosphomevalonate kinase
MRFGCSAPGKVLLTGGYVVLQREYSGCVVGVSSRIHCAVELRGEGGASNTLEIVVDSPQFLGQNHYTLERTAGGIALHTRSGESENPYIEATLRHTFATLAALDGECIWRVAGAHSNLRVVVVGDNEFYSQRRELQQRGLPLGFESLRSLPRFLGKRVVSDDINKTGLGSSAALVTSIVGALVGLFRAAELPQGDETPQYAHQLQSGDDCTLIHNVAQYCHSLAQGKIGSGFDVSAAVYGTQIYTRFSKELLDAKLAEAERSGDAGVALDHALKQWDSVHAQFRLPVGLQLVLGDVSAGSSTPTMVSKVLAWLARDAGAAQLWRELSERNNAVVACFDELRALEQHSEYAHQIAVCSNAREWSGDVGAVAHRLREQFLAARALLKRMGEHSDVPIEPDLQTELLDATMRLPGVIAAGVPGAGGYDAVFAICFAGAAARTEKLWLSWEALSVLALPVDADSRGVLSEPDEASHILSSN